MFYEESEWSSSWAVVVAMVPDVLDNRLYLVAFAASPFERSLSVAFDNVDGKDAFTNSLLQSCEAQRSLGLVDLAK